MGSGGSVHFQLTPEEAADVDAFVAGGLAQVPSLRRRVEELQAGAREAERLRAQEQFPEEAGAHNSDKLQEEVAQLNEEVRSLRQAEAAAARRIEELESRLREDPKERVSHSLPALPGTSDAGTTPHDLAMDSNDKKVFVALLSGKDCECLWLQDKTIRQLKEEAQEKLDIAIKHLIGPNMEPLDEEKMLAEGNVMPGITLTVVAVDQAAEAKQAAEDEKEAAECRTDILLAALNGRLGAVRHILRTVPGAVASKPDSQTALHYAALQGHAEICRVLLAAKAEVDASVSGSTPLHFAAIKGQVEVVKLLVEAKASVIMKSKYGQTPLDDARKQGHDEVVKILENADPKELASHAGTTPHDLAKDGDDKKVFVALLSGQDCECLWLQDRTIRQLKEEAQEKLDIAIKHLIGPNMEPLDEEKMLTEENVMPGTTLTVVAVNQAAEDEEEAAECNNDIVFAGISGHLGAVRHILRMDPGAVALKDGAGDTALHGASHIGRAEICRVLLAARAEVDARDWRGSTPLHFAANNGRVEVVKLLVEAKASVTVKGRNGQTPLDDARKQGHDEVVKILENAA